jgi:hypothetical protein
MNRRVKLLEIKDACFLKNALRNRSQSFPMQDEPEEGAGFPHKMSRGNGMLGIDHQHASSRGVEFGSDQAFLEASQEIRFEGKTREEIYQWVEKVLVHHEYQQQGRQVRGLLRQYLQKMTGLSRAQVTRLIARQRQGGKVEVTVYRRHRFAARYRGTDVELLAQVDQAHQTLSGPTHPGAGIPGIMGSRNSRGWRGSPWPISITCGKGPSTGSGACTTPRPGRRRSRLGNGVGPIPKADQDFCASTLCIREIGTATKGSITSMPWTK